MRVRSQRLQSWPSTSGSFLLAMFGHAGPVCVDLLVTPEVLRISGGPEAALVNGLRALPADMDAATFLRVARRCQRGHGECQRKRSCKINLADERFCSLRCQLMGRINGEVGLYE